MKVKVLKEYYDKTLGEYKKPNGVFDVSQERFETLKKANVVEEVKETKEVKTKEPK